MSEHEILNRLEPKIIVLGHAVEEIKSTLTSFDARAQVVDGIEDKVEDRLAVVEGKVDKIQDHLHLLVDTINVILKRLNKNLRCDEKMGVSDDDDDDDDEFDLSDYDEKIDLEVAKIQQMEDNDCMNK